MSKQRRGKKDLGIPKGLAPELKRELEQELKLMGATYTELEAAADMPVTPELLLKLVKSWNGLTSRQKAAWEHAAQQENLRGADPNCLN